MNVVLFMVNVPGVITQILDGAIDGAVVGLQSEAFSAPASLTFLTMEGKSAKTHMRLEQLLNASYPICVTLKGMYILLRREHPLNALSPIVVKLELVGMETLTRLEQPLNALLPTNVTLAGMETLTRFEHP